MTLAVNILEKILLQGKQAVTNVQGIINELRRDNMAVVLELDTSNTSTTALKLDSLMGGTVRSLTVLDVGGGLNLQTGVSDFFATAKGDRIYNEELETVRWAGLGAGTAVLRLTGLRL